jgi:hypothetical protein
MSKGALRCCDSSQNDHILNVCCAFSTLHALHWALIHPFEKGFKNRNCIRMQSK